MNKFKQIPIFDSLCHPCLQDPGYKNYNYSFDKLNTDLTEEKISKALAVGIDTLGGYDKTKYISECKEHDKLVPIAAFEYSKIKDQYSAELLAQEIKNIKDLGYKGIKVHPRSSNLDIFDSILDDLFEFCSKEKLPILFCTYCYGKDNPSEQLKRLADLLKKNPEVKLIFMHGGVHQILEYSELVRSNPNTLLDLSFTFLKYSNSSRDLDIKFLFQNFDQRICIGSDHPDFNHRTFVEKLHTMSEGIAVNKLENIYYKNLCSFLGVTI